VPNCRVVMGGRKAALHLQAQAALLQQQHQLVPHGHQWTGERRLAAELRTAVPVKTAG